MADLKKLVNELSKLTVVEAAELSKMLEESWGVSAAPAVAVGAAAPEAPVVEEKTSFDVVLIAAGDKKINVIKELRTVTDLGLKEAKELVDNPPKAVRENVGKDEAAEIKKKLEAAGATVELK